MFRDCTYKDKVKFLCPRHSKNGGGALSVNPVRAYLLPLSEFGVRSIIQI